MAPRVQRRGVYRKFREDAMALWKCLQPSFTRLLRTALLIFDAPVWSRSVTCLNRCRSYGRGWC